MEQFTLDAGYKEIKIPGDTEPNENIEVELIEEEDLPEADTSNDVLTEEEGSETNRQSEPPKKETSGKPRGSRAEKRIKQLASDKSDLLARLEKAEREKYELMQQLSSGTKSSKEVLKGQLETNLTMLNKQLTEAIRNAEAEEAVALQDAIMNTKMELAGVSYELQNHREVPEQKPVQVNSGPSERVLEWVEDHPQFKSDEVFNAAAIAVNNQLLREGYNPENDDFYKQLNKRLSPRFPEVFGTSNTNSVQLSEDTSEDGDDGEDSSYADDKEEVTNKTKPQTNSQRVTEQTVAAPSRTPHNVVQKAKKATTVTLTQQDVAQAARWGLSVQEMARRMRHQEDNKRTDGYVPIFMD